MKSRLPGLPDSRLVFAVSCGLALLGLGALSWFLREGNLGVILLDRQSSTWPFTIQTFMILLFALALGGLYQRFRVAQWELRFVERKLLPEDHETVLQRHDLAPLRRRVVPLFDAENGFLPFLIDLCILQFQASRSVDQTVSVLNSSLDLISHRVELRYSMIRYVVWAIPTFGFIGTVLGISGGLTSIDPASGDLTPVLEHLGRAFNTTLVALVLSAILVFFLHLVERREEESVNQAGSYCLRNLINRLYSAGP